MGAVIGYIIGILCWALFAYSLQAFWAYILAGAAIAVLTGMAFVRIVKEPAAPESEDDGGDID